MNSVVKVGSSSTPINMRVREVLMNTWLKTTTSAPAIRPTAESA